MNRFNAFKGLSGTGAYSTWATTLLHPSNSYTNNIAPYHDERLDMRFFEPLKIFRFKCVDRLLPLDELIVARHKTRVGERKGKHDIISMIVVARYGVAKPMLETFWNQKFKTYIMPSYEDDARARIGITKNCADQDDREKLNKFIEAVHKIVPLNGNIKDLIQKIMQPENIDVEHKWDIPKDTEKRPIILRDYQSILTWGGYIEPFDEQYDVNIPKELPELFVAITESDEEKCKAMLSQDPTLADSKDQFGNRADNIARIFLSPEGFEHFYNAKVECMRRADERAQKSQRVHLLYSSDYRDQLNNWRHGIASAKAEKPERKELTWAGVILGNDTSMRDKKRQKYLANCRQPGVPRSAFHTACIEGDLARMQQHKPKDINEHDPYGYPALVLVVANGHHDSERYLACAKWLITEGASLTPPGRVNDVLPYNILDNVSTPQLMELMLHSGVDPTRFIDRLIRSIEVNDIDIVKVMLYYARTLPMNKGVELVDLAAKLVSRYGTDMLDLLLLYYNQFMPEGPYDLDVADYLTEKAGKCDELLDPKGPYCNFDPRLPDIYKKHNADVRKRMLQKQHLPKLKSPTKTSPQHIEDHFEVNGSVFVSVIKPISKLKPKEKTDIKILFNKAFRTVQSNTDLTPEDYIKAAFNAGKNNYINLFFHKGELKSFMTFELIRDSHSSTGEFILFHAKLAANDGYDALGLTRLAFRVLPMLRFMFPDLPIYSFLKAIPPGYGMCLLPDNIEYYPKLRLPVSFVSHVATLVHDPIYGKSMLAKLAINEDRLPEKQRKQLLYYTHILGAGDKKALPVVYQLNDEIYQAYLNDLSLYGVGTQHLENLSTHMKAQFHELLKDLKVSESKMRNKM